MRKSLVISVILLSGLIALPASADFFALETDVQGSYLRLGNITLPDTDVTGTITGMGVGARARIQILFLNALVDYHHLMTGGRGADVLHAGLGLGYRMDSIPIVDLYVQGSIGVLMLYAAPSAFVEDVVSELGPEIGGQVRAGGGLEIPFGADFFAIGVGADVGGHYITGEFGYDFSVNVHFGLRI
jgi:hypothetical protein